MREVVADGNLYGVLPLLHQHQREEAGVQHDVAVVGDIGIGAPLAALGGVVEGDAQRDLADDALQDGVAEAYLKLLLGLAGTHLDGQRVEGDVREGGFGHLAEGGVGNQFLVDGGQFLVMVRADFVKFLVHVY